MLHDKKVNGVQLNDFGKRKEAAVQFLSRNPSMRALSMIIRSTDVNFFLFCLPHWVRKIEKLFPLRQNSNLIPSN